MPAFQTGKKLLNKIKIKISSKINLETTLNAWNEGTLYKAKTCLEDGHGHGCA